MTQTLDAEVRELLEQRRGEWESIRKQGDVSYSWISKFVRGKIPNPGYSTLKRLHAALTGSDGKAA